MGRSIMALRQHLVESMAQNKAAIAEIDDVMRQEFIIDFFTIKDAQQVNMGHAPYIHSKVHECFDWCFENDIVYRIKHEKITHHMSHETMEPTEYTFIEFSDEAGMVAFKLKWCGGKREE